MFTVSGQNYILSFNTRFARELAYKFALLVERHVRRDEDVDWQSYCKLWM